MRVEKYKFKNWKESETGLLIDEDDSWILVRHIPVDYVIDGYKIYNKNFIQKREHSTNEICIEKVLILKNIEISLPENFFFSNTINLLKWVESKYGIFEFQDDDESELFYGKLRSVNKGNLIIDMILEDGSVDVDKNNVFNIDEIRAIAFESDYHLSLRLLWQDKLNK